jgi:hypothetical protein
MAIKWLDPKKIKPKAKKIYLVCFKSEYGLGLAFAKAKNLDVMGYEKESDDDIFFESLHHPHSTRGLHLERQNANGYDTYGGNEIRTRVNSSRFIAFADPLGIDLPENIDLKCCDCEDHKN